MTKNLSILIANGVNLDLLGNRQPEIYGTTGLSELEASLRKIAASFSQQFCRQIRLEFFQSNSEGLFLEEISKSWDGIVLNPGAWTHTSLALADRLQGCAASYVEVHISNLAAREEYRQRSYTAPYALGSVTGFGLDSYHIGLYSLLTKITQ